MFVFYDLEATGTSAAFDQVLQVAAIRTDANLDPIDRFEARCRRLPWVVPSPAALRVTGITPAMLEDSRLPGWYELARATGGCFRRWSPAIFLGWNSFVFDEPLLRQTLFQSLQQPFLTTAGGNGRGCVMRIVQAAALYAAERVQAPRDHRGRPTFRLDHVAPAFGCGAADSHDAMADAEAALCVARRIKALAPAVWERMIRCCHKRTVLDELSDTEMLVLTDFTYGRLVSRLVTGCGRHPEDAMEVAVFDLAHDPAPYLERTVEELVRLLARSPKVIRALRATSQPALMPVEWASPEVAAREIPEVELRRRATMVAVRADFRERVGEALRLRRLALQPPSPIEHRLYERFPETEHDDEARIDRFHTGDWEERARLCRAIADSRRAELARRLVFAEAPEALSAEEHTALRRWGVERVLSEDADVPWRTIPMALREAENLLAEAEGSHRGFLEDVQRHLETIDDHWSGVAAGLC
ncbi:MAG: hypothetical protein EA406_01110 [Rhodospirillales bacterium]|nr:MAG: hypothetical protein EA406_01110 [Rhodospirillales bacterium]